MTVIKFDEKRRNDPAVREAVREVLLARQQAVIEAKAFVDAALEALNSTPYPHLKEQPLFERIRNSVWKAAIEIENSMSKEPPNETYIGNAAASQLGQAVCE